MDDLVMLLAFVTLAVVWWLVVKKLANKHWVSRHLTGASLGVVSLFVVTSIGIATGVIEPPPAEPDTANNALVQTSGVNPAYEPSVKQPSESVGHEITARGQVIAVTSNGFSLVSDEYQTPFKRTVEVALDSRVTEAELAVIAETIKAQASHPTDRTFISYRVEGATSGAYWATTHYAPELSVRIIGMTSSEAEVARVRSITKYANVAEMIVSLGDYDEDNGTYRLISADPLHIHLLPQVYQGDSTETVEGVLKRAVIYGVFKTLAHTDVNQVRVTSTPMMTRLNPISLTPQDSPRLDLSLSRAAALDAVQQFLEVDDVESVISHQGGGGFTYESWSDGFTNLYYEDRNPGLKAFYADLNARSDF